MNIDKDTLNFIAQHPNITDDRTQKLLLDLNQEPSRQSLIKWVIVLVGGLHVIFVIAGGVLVFLDKIAFRDMLDLILVLGWLAGALTTIINFYFKH